MEKIEDIEDIIVILYQRGHSLNSIVNTVYRYGMGNIPLNFSFKNFNFDNSKKYTKLDCLNYVSRVILNFNASRK